MRQSLAWAAVLSLAVLACNGTGSGLIGIATSGGGNDTTGLTATVRIENFAFNPTVVNLQRGGVVTWVWALDTVSHNVTFSDPSLSSPTQSVGTHTVVFTAQGTFTYRCTIHSGMNGSVVVR
ncbi:MAG TPA: plastocyanin/azurin family copper-binding protein [Gemmatimonadales bacterium]|jgi:plastocyanin|nr:plastocyanin/azurin family copper-binding protein [Gemmatimonadales bacterium]